MRRNLQDELKHKISNNFYEAFQDQIQNTFDKILILDGTNNNDIELVRSEQNHMFNSILKELKNIRTLDTKTYANVLLQQFFDKPSSKNLKKFNKFIKTYTEGWTDEMKDDFHTELMKILDSWKSLHPKWKEWIKKIIRLLPSLLGG